MEMLIFCGLQGAGKSTYYSRHLWDTHVRLNMDMLKTRHREQILLDACLRAKQPLVIDNTNPIRAVRARYLQAAQAARFRCICLWFVAGVDEAMQRNELRTGKALVPKVGILSTYKNFEAPSLDEGFAEIWQVQTGADGQFTLHKVEHEI